jgi:secreted PhoX family phosphatase
MMSDADPHPYAEPLCNRSGNRPFADVAAARFNRRTFLRGSLNVAVASFLASSGLPARAAVAVPTPSSKLGFKPVPVSSDDLLHLPAGYEAQIVLRWGDPILGDFPAFAPDNDSAAQAQQAGMHHDGMHFFPIEGADPWAGSSSDGLLVLNHEYIEPRYLHLAVTAGKPMGSWEALDHGGPRNPDQVRKELCAHGVSIVRVRLNGDGQWELIPDRRNRRITTLTPMAISGPVRGSDGVKTRYSPDGTATRGTLNNCAHGVTPWNTYLCAEENWAGYFVNRHHSDEQPDQPREHSRYGVPTDVSWHNWHLAADGADEYIRFDATPSADRAAADYRNEPNTFGWMCEIDPFDPDSTPIKRTALGRFAHEGAVFAPAQAGARLVCYLGDDARFEYLYKYVSDQPYQPGVTGGELLDDGVLYAARFNPDGTGEWLALQHGQNGLDQRHGFRDQADVLINTRSAADHVGATPMDRPEWGAVDHATGTVYFTLTNNNQRTEAQVDAANPRAVNLHGQIIRWREDGAQTATTFRWDLFLLGGDATSGVDAAGKPLGPDSILSSPDGLWIDGNRRLWIQTDIAEAATNQGPYAPFGNNQMLAADPDTGEIRRFLTGPIGQEITGVVATPDHRTLFINVQHPGANTSSEDFAAGNYASHWPDGGASVPRSATIAIRRKDRGVIGT